jgi:hypothetical protein
MTSVVLPMRTGARSGVARTLAPHALVVVAVVGCGRHSFQPLAHDAAPFDALSMDMVELDAATHPPGLVVWHPLDDDSYEDRVSGAVGSCTPPGCPTSMPGRIGQALRFDGLDDCITVDDAGHLQLAQLTIALWAVQTLSRNMSQVSKKVTSAGNWNSWQIESEASGLRRSVTFTTYNGNSNHFASTVEEAIVIGQWHHLAVTYDGAAKRVYIDGTEKQTSAYSIPLMYDGNPMKIGCDDNTPEGLFFAGTLDDLQLYDRALTAAEVAALAAR